MKQEAWPCLHGFLEEWWATRVYPFIMLKTQRHVPVPVGKNNYKTPGRPSRAAAGPPPGRRRAARARAGAVFFDFFFTRPSYLVGIKDLLWDGGREMECKLDGGTEREREREG